MICLYNEPPQVIRLRGLFSAIGLGTGAIPILMQNTGLLCSRIFHTVRALWTSQISLGIRRGESSTFCEEYSGK